MASIISLTQKALAAPRAMAQGALFLFGRPVSQKNRDEPRFAFVEDLRSRFLEENQQPARSMELSRAVDETTLTGRLIVGFKVPVLGPQTLWRILEYFSLLLSKKKGHGEAIIDDEPRPLESLIYNLSKDCDVKRILSKSPALAAFFYATYVQSLARESFYSYKGLAPCVEGLPEGSIALKFLLELARLYKHPLTFFGQRHSLEDAATQQRKVMVFDPTFENLPSLDAINRLIAFKWLMPAGQYKERIHKKLGIRYGSEMKAVLIQEDWRAVGRILENSKRRGT